VSAARPTTQEAYASPSRHVDGCKSGTAQVYRITEAERAAGLVRPELLPWHRRDNALFIAFAPVDQPRYACAVVVEHGIGGGAVAGRSARAFSSRRSAGCASACRRRSASPTAEAEKGALGDAHGTRPAAWPRGLGLAAQEVRAD